MYQNKVLKIIKMHLLMGMSQIIDIYSQTLLHNFEFGIFKFFKVSRLKYFCGREKHFLFQFFWYVCCHDNGLRALFYTPE